MRRQLWGGLMRGGLLGRAGLRAEAFSSGAQILGGGKHKGLSYDDVMAQDPQYCNFIMQRHMQQQPMGRDLRGLVDYMQSKQAGDHDVGRTHEAAFDAPAEADDGGHQPDAAEGDVVYFSEAADDAGGSLVRFGKHKGLTFQQVLEQEPDYCQWVLREATARAERGEPAREDFTALVGYIQANGTSTTPAYGRRGQAAQSYSRGSYGGRGASQAYNQTQTAEESDLVTGGWQVAFGTKFKGWTFDQVIEADKSYCDYIVDQVLHSSTPKGSNMMPFAVYVQYVKLRLSA